MKTLIKDGKRLTYTNGSGSDISSGDVVLVGSQIGIATTDIANGEVGELAMEGVFEVPKTGGAAFVDGTAIIWDESAGAFVAFGTATAAGDLTHCCIAHGAAASAAVLANIKINVGVGLLI